MRSDAREALWREVADEIADIYRGLGHAPLKPSTLAAVRAVRREEFLPAENRHLAHVNAPQSIGCGQTISQPLIVALMTDLLDVGPEDTVLEVGAGSGYQAAVLSRVVRQVHTVEIIPSLARSAADRLSRLGFANVEVHAQDGWMGLREQAPFGGIIVTAAASVVPPALIEQLANGRSLVIPVGARWEPQDLFVITKGESGELSHRRIIPVAFVPLTGGVT